MSASPTRTLRAAAEDAGTIRARAAARDAFLAGNAITLPPVAVVIAALDEEESVGTTIAEVPRSACGLETAVLVIDDGSRDATAAVAREAGARVVSLERNLGHGVALRLGYDVAARLGARYIVTLDADGQWNPVELERVLEPVVAGEADFSIGSRVLGAGPSGAPLRSAGVRFFGWIARRLTGVPVTDTSSGFRALTVDVARRVPQHQIQYQTSELLIGAVAHGFRVVERPIVMRARTAGESKKGHDVLYGIRYARVLLGTAWRERRGLVRVRRGRP